MKLLGTIVKTLPELPHLIVKNYPFTLAIGALILLATIPYNVLVPETQYCSNWPEWAGTWLHLTSPFNIGCEASLADLWTEAGAGRFASNFTFVLVLCALVEHILNPINRRLKRNVFAAAIMAGYLLEISTLHLFKTLTVGTSIIAVSMMLTLICGFFYRAWLLRNYPNKSWMPLAGAIFLSLLAFALYSAESALVHMVGGIYFLLFMVLFLKSPNWLEEWCEWINNIRNSIFKKK